MELFWKAAAAALIASVLTLMVGKQQKEFSQLISMTVCAMALAILVSFLEPVLDFLRELQTLGDLNGSMLTILLKATGIGLIAEISAMTCTDAGNATLGKMLQLLSAAAIMWLSLPVFQMLMDLVTRILGDV